MLYLFAGDDTEKKILAYKAFLDSFEEDREILKLNRNDFDPLLLESFYSSSGLFTSQRVITLSGFLKDEESRDFILRKIEFFAESVNNFVFLEDKINKSTLDILKKVRTELNIFELPKFKLEKFNNFLLANAFGIKDKFHLWIYFRQAVGKGVALEELTGVLSWKVKDMLMKKNFGKFSEMELKNFLIRISYLLPEARGSGKDAESSFERFLLEAF